MGRNSRSRSRDSHRSSRSHRHRSHSYDSRRSSDRHSRRHSRSPSRSHGDRSGTNKKKGLFDQKPEGIPEALLTATGTIGVLANTLNAKTAESKSILRLFITNLPTEYQDMKLKDFLVDVILKCVDQPVPQPPITSLIAYKDQGYAIVEFATPELATACLALDGLPYEGISIGVVRPPTFNPADVPMPSGRPPRLQLDKIGFTPKLGARAIADAMAQGDNEANCKWTRSRSSRSLRRSAR
ncbi:RNA binding protein [Blastocystis hominis]|uniref:RNA binding protein n=1 Tax=Blastocystis hominis TaxID=12968 RepID=D8M0E6_BLAHO|nr:RNA binding protein [Blastocystis hominis]CBK21535.2 RNA binding protein [Blastocystis hominis]|eukprot:XP_012895583.1 RNA binding protein [Blastocystis hominis]